MVELCINSLACLEGEVHRNRIRWHRSGIERFAVHGEVDLQPASRRLSSKEPHPTLCRETCAIAQLAIKQLPFIGFLDDAQLDGVPTLVRNR